MPFILPDVRNGINRYVANCYRRGRPLHGIVLKKSVMVPLGTPVMRLKRIYRLSRNGSDDGGLHFGLYRKPFIAGSNDMGMTDLNSYADLPDG